MYYTGFEIKNYKGIKELSLNLLRDPQSKIFTLVGLNESGKTTILEAISLLNIPNTPQNAHDFIPKSLRINFTDTIDITARLNFEDHDKEYLKDKLKTLGYKNPVFENEVMLFKLYRFEDSEHKVGSNQRLCLYNVSAYKGNSKISKEISKIGEVKIIIHDIILNELIPPILYYPNFLFDFPERIYLEKHVNESDEQPQYREVLGDILSSIDPTLNIQTHLLSRLKSSKTDARKSLESTLLKMSSKVTKVVFRAWDAIFDSKGKEIVISSSVDEDGDYFLEFNLKEHSNYYQIAERSLGFRWFFTFLLFTEFRKNRASSKGEILFMLDEPASNLHSTAQKKLLETFEDILENAKLIYTTHSHHLINPKWLSSAYIIRNRTVDFDNEIDYDAESTDIEAVLYKTFVANHPNQRTYFQPILDTLDYQPGLLEEVPNIIITEGKNDYYILKLFIKIANNTEYDDLKIYPGGGAHRNSQTIALYLGWGKMFTVFLDSDKGGISAKNNYLKEFGPIVQPRIKTFEDVDASFINFAIEDLFSEDDRLKITALYDSKMITFKKSAFNTSIENLFINNEIYPFSESTMENFRKVLQFLKQSQ